MNRRELLLSTLSVNAISCRLIWAQDNLDPLTITPGTHKLLFENRFVRVIESKVPPNTVEPKHSHPHCVTVYLADVDVEIRTFPDGQTTRVHRTAGTAGWSEATVHEVRNVGRTSSHNIRIELKC
jgi:hypothetical protein